MLAVTPTAFGEVLLGMRLARELRARDHEVRLLAPESLRAIALDAGVRFGAFDPVASRLDVVLASLVRDERLDSITLLDAAAVFQGFDRLHLDASVFARLGVPVVALDIWNLDESGLAWDHAGGRIDIDGRATAIPRIVPVPFARPTAARGYNALPVARPIDRRAARDELGLGDARVIFWPTALWQAPRLQATASGRRLAEAVPTLLVHYVAALGPDVRVVHVGPEPMRAGAALGDRYRWIPQLPAERFHALLAASDVMLGANLAATTLPSAIAYEVPAVVAVNSYAEASSEAIEAVRGRLGARARAWVEANPALYRFRVWPAGLHATLGAVIAGNPFTEAIEIVELLDEERMVSTLRMLLFDDAAATRARERQRAYRAEVARLPPVIARFEAALAECT